MDAGFPEYDENNTNANADTTPSTDSDVNAPEGSIDLNAHLTAASTSFWGFVSSATTTLKKTSAAAASVVNDVKETVKKDFSEFQQSLSEESVEIKKEAKQFLDASGTSDESPDSTNPSESPPSGALNSVSESPSPNAVSTNSSDMQSSSTLASSTSSISPSPPSASSSASASASPEAVSTSSSTSSLNASTSSGTWSTKIVDNVERVGDSLLNKAVDLLPASIWTFGGSLEDDAEKPGAPHPYSGTSRKEEDRSILSELKTGSSNDKLPNVGLKPSASPHTAYSPASVKDAKQAQMESNHLSFTTDPTSPNSNSPSAEFVAFSKHFHADYDSMWKDEVETKLPSVVSPIVTDMYQHLVVAPSNQWNTPRVDAKQFWCRFLFRQRLIEAEEAKRTALLGKIQQQTTKPTTEDDSWGDDDDNSNSSSPSQTTSETPVVPTPSPAAPSIPEPVAAVQRSPAASESPVVVEPTQAPTGVPAVAPTSAPAAVNQTPAPAPSVASVPKVKETPQQMRARLEAEAKERIQQKLAEKKKQLAAQAAASSASTAPTAAAVPPVSSSSVAVEHSSDQSTFVTPAFSDIIQQSIPTNTTPEPLKRQLQRGISSTGSSPSPSPAPLPLHPNSHTHAHTLSATPADLQSASPPLPTNLSRSSSRSSNHSNNGWVDVDQEKSATITAAQSSAATAAIISPPSAGSNASSETKSSDSSNADGWDEWE